MAQVNVYIPNLQVSLVCFLVHPTLHFQYKPELPPKNVWPQESEPSVWLQTGRALYREHAWPEELHNSLPLLGQGLRKTSLLHVNFTFFLLLNLISLR